jgi:hypothetical protein
VAARILVGTMYSGEQEFHRCVQSISEQVGCASSHFIVEGLPHQRAHAELYSTFRERAADHDLFVKVDADMVLARRTVLCEIAEWFAQNRAFDKLTIGIHDFFPDRLVSGLHAWRNTVSWPETDRIFADTDGVRPDRTSCQFKELAPAAYHCPDPSCMQCFHYGMIRAVKVATGLSRGWLNTLCLDLIEDTWRHLGRNADRRLALACLGAELAFAGRFGGGDLDYSSPLVEQSYRRYETLTVEQLTGTARRFRLRNRLLHSALCAASPGLPGLFGRYALSVLSRRAMAPTHGAA